MGPTVEAKVMSAVTYKHDAEPEFTSGNPAEEKHGVFSRIMAALHRSRRLQAERELTRHRHLIEEARAYEARNRKR
jgi:hypothetical protein